MRIPLIAGNWKMNKTIDEAKAFMQAVSEQVTDPADVETAIAAPALLLSTMLANNPGQKLRIAARTVTGKMLVPLRAKRVPRH